MKIFSVLRPSTICSVLNLICSFVWAIKVQGDVEDLRREQQRILKEIWAADSSCIDLDERTLQWVEDSMDITYEIEDAIHDINPWKILGRKYKIRTIKEGRKWVNERKKKIKKIRDRIREIDGDRKQFGAKKINNDRIQPHRDELMSYNKLSLGMKRCFLYFAVFPRDFKIEARSLFRIWVAERLIPYKERETLEEATEKRWMEKTGLDGPVVEPRTEPLYIFGFTDRPSGLLGSVTLEEALLEDFVQRKIVQVSDRFPDGSIRYCQFPSVLRSLAIQISNEIKFLMVCSNPDDWRKCGNAYRVAVHCSNDNEPTDNYENLRSLLLFGESSRVDCSKYKMLRVLGNMRGEVKLESFRGSPHLRYLQLNTAFKERDFGKWIRGMRNLETLDLRLSIHGDLSSWIWRVKTLRHVLLSEYYGETQWPQKLAYYHKNIQTLTSVNWCKSGVTSMTLFMPEVRELGILIYRKPERIAFSAIASLLDKSKHLDYLKIQGAANSQIIPMDKFPFYENLKSLVLINDDYNSDYTLDLRDGMLPPNLTELELGFVFGLDPMPVLEKLEKLNTLRIRGARDIRNNPLTSISCSAGGFKQLEELVLESLRLKEWKIEVGAIPKLKRLNIRLCPLLIMPPELIHLHSLEYLTCTVIKIPLYFANRDATRNIFEQQPHLQGGLREVFGDFIPFDSF